MGKRDRAEFVRRTFWDKEDEEFIPRFRKLACGEDLVESSEEGIVYAVGNIEEYEVIDCV